MQIGTSISQTCADFLQIPSVIGFEEPFFQFLEKDFKSMGCEVESLYNRYGRRVLMAVSNCQFNADKLVSAHIDRHGLYKILDPNLVYFSQAYKQMRDVEYAAHAIRRINFDKEEFNQEHLLKVCNYFIGEKIIAYHPATHEQLIETQISGSDICIIDEYLTFDLPELEELNTLPYQFIPIAFAPRDHPSTAEMIGGQIDNTISVAIIHQLLSNNVPTTALLTTDEEIGESWLFLERYFSKKNLAPKNLLVLDTSPYSQTHGLQQLQTSGSVVLRYADNYAPFNRQMTHQLRLIAEDLDIPYDFKDLTVLRNGQTHLGNTELGKLILRSQGKFSGTTLQIPTDEYHTNREKASILSVDNCYKLAEAYLKS